jgi:hypothetical protein
LQHALKDENQGGEIVSLRPPMHDRFKVAGLAWRVERSHVRGRRAAHDRKYTLDRLQHAGHAPECERGRAKSSNLSVGGIVEPAHKLNGICGRVDAIKGGVQDIEAHFERVFPHATDATYAAHATP